MEVYDDERELKNVNEEDIQTLREEMAFYGHIENDTKFFHTKDYEGLLLDFIRLKKGHVYDFKLPSRTTRIITTQANKIITAQLDGVDRRVLYTHGDNRIVQDFIAEFGTEIDEKTIDDFIRYLKANSRKREITAIDKIWTSSDTRNGGCSFYEPCLDDIEAIRKWPIICTGITMENQADDLSSSILVHEMVHALVNRHKGIVENRLHRELLSIYMELVAAYEIDDSETLLKDAIIFRLQDLKGNMITQESHNYRGYIDNQPAIYIDSTLYAFALFEQYRNASDAARKALKKEINEVFSGKRTLEETLEALDITEAEGSQIIRSHVKKIMR